MSPDGSKVYVTGESWGKPMGYDYATISYRAATGARLWLRRYAPGDIPAAVTVSPDGTKVFVTGFGSRGGPGNEQSSYFATVAYHS